MYVHFEILIGPHGILKWTHEIFDKNKLNRHTNIHFKCLTGLYGVQNGNMNIHFGIFDRARWSFKTSTSSLYTV